MANDRDSLGETLEGRYATDHVGGAFDAKVIQKPRTTEKILEDSTLGSRKADESLLAEGLSTQRYKGEDHVVAETKPAPMLQPRGVAPASVTPGQTMPRNIISAVRAEPGQTGRVSKPSPPAVTPGQSVPRSIITKSAPSGQTGRAPVEQPSVTPGQSLPRSVIVKQTVPGKTGRTPIEPPSVTPGQSVPRSVIVKQTVPGQVGRVTIEKPSMTPSQGGRSLARKADPGGSGKPGFGHRPFVPTPPPPFGPLISLPVPVYWNTDPDIWDYAKVYGQTYWNSDNPY